MIQLNKIHNRTSHTAIKGILDMYTCMINPYILKIIENDSPKGSKINLVPG